MNELLKNTWVKAIGGVLLANVLLFVHYQMVVIGATRSVIKQLQQYSPSPYGPSFNPDKVSPEALQKQQTSAIKMDGPPQTVDFRTEWESSRATPVQ